MPIFRHIAKIAKNHKKRKIYQNGKIAKKCYFLEPPKIAKNRVLKNAYFQDHQKCLFLEPQKNGIFWTCENTSFISRGELDFLFFIKTSSFL